MFYLFNELCDSDTEILRKLKISLRMPYKHKIFIRHLTLSIYFIKSIDDKRTQFISINKYEN